MTIQKLICFLLFTISLFGQEKTKGNLRGNYGLERVWWDLQYYDLEVEVFPETETIQGKNTITYKVLQAHQTLQLDLQKPLQIDSIIQNGKPLKTSQKEISYFVQLQDKQRIDSIEKITIYYHGKPKKAKNAPWDGGFTWDKDTNNTPFIATANQSIGASVWWPCKDHPYDEVDFGAKISITCPSNLTDVSNGKLINTIQNTNNTTTYIWEVKNPINAYSICINIGDYTNFKENYKGLNGDLNCNYYVLNGNLLKAKHQFKQVQKTLEAFEYWLGPYSFYQDDFKLIETPYLGMEHQSAIAYGNGYQNGYLGYAMGDSKWSLLFDYIIVHETGHEWFANNITCKDVADLWLHESFTTYAESLYVDYHYGKQAANEYIQGFKDHVKNDKPILGKYNYRKEGSSDMYMKGALTLHTLRHTINDDLLWKEILTGLNKEFYHTTVNQQQVIVYIEQKSHLNLKGFFKQYIETTKIPTLITKQEGEFIKYKWKNVVEGFELNIKTTIDQKETWIKPTQEWQQVVGNIQSFEIDANFYINLKK